MPILRSKLILSFPLLLGACASVAPSAYTDPNAGFANVSSETAKAVGARTTFAFGSGNARCDLSR